MRVPVSWLREYCDPGWDSDRLAERLALTGTEVERVSHAGAPSSEGFVVGRVTGVGPHPDADRLSVCTVDTGDGERTIVCGAPNVAAGQLVPVALPGAVLPGDVKLKKAKLRGVESDGMILSESELELGEDSDGIAVIDQDIAGSSGEPARRRAGARLARPGPAHRARPGTPLAEVVAVSDDVLELEVTSNRADCLAIYGVAREVHAISEASLADPPWSEDAEAAGEGAAVDYASVTVEVPELCPRFTARVFTGVTVGPSPIWLKARLVAAGQRPINNVVDITNYVMLLTGQPLHAFDLAQVPDGALVVRTARPGERITTLDGVERSLESDTVLVCDREKASGIAGIMGGAASEVSERTSRVLLEVATWDGVNILRTSRRLGLRSEASARFEKQLHPALTMRAQRIASRLLIELCGAKLVPGTIDAGEEPDPIEVTLRVPRVGRLIGLEIDAETCAARLERLGFGVRRNGDEIRATVPPERASDVSREADLIEEVARLGNLDTELPSTLPATRERIGRLTREQLLRRDAEDALRGIGADEIVGWSLAAPDLPERLRLPAGDPRRELVELSNPLSVEHSVLRPLLLASLLDAARLNLARGAEHVVLFESGHAYLRDGDRAGGELGGSFSGGHPAPVYEPHRLAYLASGEPPQRWRGEPVPYDYFAAKAALEALLGRLGLASEVEAAEQPFLHPGRSARLLVEGAAVGWVGELHPLVARDWDLAGGAAFEVDLAPLIAAAPSGGEPYHDVTTFPAVYQDVAVVVPDDVAAARVREVVLEGGGELLRSAEVFDLYRGEQVGENSKSLALRLSFQAPDRTLTDEEVGERRAAITAALERIGGSLRE
ncbi:MAG TPA: phenylalanine--tRNA ligase subunit beta [Solirubrobacterales bacterium]|nr:phenylalanine--tRNA ligase subunit beta [Solirubrobacterales bacterium]